MIKCLTIIQIESEFGNVGFEERGSRSTRRKTSRSKEENQPQTQPTYDAGSGKTRDTLVGDERSQHCAIPAPQIFMFFAIHAPQIIMFFKPLEVCVFFSRYTYQMQII